ncbi:MAG: hypothetical protein ACE1S7_04060 [Candidatus Tisiphia sp.]
MKLSINSEATPSPPSILTKEQLKSIYLQIFSGEDGRIVLEDLASIKWCVSQQLHTARKQLHRFQ